MSHISIKTNYLVINLRTDEPEADRERLLKLVAAQLRWFGSSAALRDDDSKLMHLAGQLMEALTMQEY